MDVRYHNIVVIVHVCTQFKNQSINKHMGPLWKTQYQSDSVFWLRGWKQMETLVIMNVSGCLSCLKTVALEILGGVGLTQTWFVCLKCRMREKTKWKHIHYEMKFETVWVTFLHLWTSIITGGKEQDGRDLLLPTSDFNHFR